MATSPTPDRAWFRAILAQLASKTQAKIPTLNGRVEKACKLVLAGDVALQEGNAAIVGSLSDPGLTYQLTDGTCKCRDWQQAPEHLCCHRLAVGFVRKIAELMPPEALPVPPAPLPEAPASLNFRAMVSGFEVQMTLRDTDEAALLTRLQAVLKRPDVKPMPKPAPRQQWRSKGH